MLMHHEAYRLLTYERMNTYLLEAAARRQSRLAAPVPERRVSFVNAVRSTAAWLLCAAGRALGASTAGPHSPCKDSHRTAS